jgi:hypothetical protein
MMIDRRHFIAASVSGAGIVGVGLGLATYDGNEELASGTVALGKSFPRLPIGMNLNGIADWEPGFPFRNLFWGARSWMTRNLDGSEPFNTETHTAFQYDDDGYPLQVPIAVSGQQQPQTVFTLLPNVRKAGVYVLLYDGEGEIGGYGATKIISQRKGRVMLHMRHARGQAYEGIVIRQSVRGNHIRNIRLIAIADENVDLDKSPFLPEFLDFCRPFHCLRFMDWGATNNSLEEEWASRKRPTFYTMVGATGDPDGRWGPPPGAFKMMYSGGVAIEIMIKLCNELKIDPWFCIPHRATDHYIAEFAKLVRTQLAPQRKVYVEYSNELWNWSFHQAGWMLRSPLAGALVEAKGGTPWKDAAKTEGRDHPERIGALFRRAFRIWENEWSGPDQQRLRRVCTVQAAWFDASHRTIRWCVENGGADIVSPAAYVGPDDAIYADWATAGTSLTAEQVISSVRFSSDIARAHSSIARIVRYGASLGLKYAAYEGGQHIQPKGQADLPYNPALAAAQSHPAMYDLYLELLRFHRDLGCELFCHFSSVSKQGSRWGSWGSKGDYDEPDAASPKMRALRVVNISKD